MAHESIDVDHLAELCRIELSEEEKKVFTQQLDTLLEYLQQLNEVNVDHTAPTLHPTEHNNPLREDIPGENLPVEAVLRNAPVSKSNQIVVPRIVE